MPVSSLTAPTASLSAIQPQAAPLRSLRPVRLWLWSVALCIFLMVIVGGATRLTQSGLSITEWDPIMGAVPPLTTEAWQAAFEKYKTIPQFSQLFPDMDLAGFKAIFYWEWAHRLLGRLIGLLVALPLALFWLTGRLPPRLKPQLLGLLALGALQGAIGWWMVKSGLSQRTDVSQYRLALHLLVASITFAWVLWMVRGLAPAGRTARSEEPRALRREATVLVLAVFLQLGLGALVAGLHAGLTYNTWPMMDGRLVPPAEHLFSLAPAWLNAFENVTTVQFDHRMLAYAVSILALGHALHAFRIGSPATRRRAAALLILVLGQIALGVVTLLLVVPLPAALLHQAFALVVFGATVVHRRAFTPLIQP